jgi:dihydroxyacetone kinase-like predicted kinase
MDARLDAATLARGLRAMLGELRRHEQELNRLNVFPVRDHDTGTNLALTVQSAVAQLDGSHTMAEVTAAITEGSLLGARGNSGVILAEALRGLCATWAPLDQVGPDDLVRGFRAAADHAAGAVLRPVDGTIVTVVRATAEALEAAPGGDVAELLDRAVDAAARAVTATTGQLAVLRDAGVVDAAGRGFELCLRALAGALRPAPQPPAGERAGAAAGRPGPDPHPAGAPGRHLTARGQVEVQFLLQCPERAVEELRRRLGRLGDSVAVVGGGGRYQVHLHTREPAAAVEAAAAVGVTSRVRVTPLPRQ